MILSRRAFWCAVGRSRCTRLLCRSPGFFDEPETSITTTRTKSGGEVRIPKGI
jgi:hypothetical protein